MRIGNVLSQFFITLMYMKGLKFHKLLKFSRIDFLFRNKKHKLTRWDIEIFLDSHQAEIHSLSDSLE